MRATEIIIVSKRFKGVGELVWPRVNSAEPICLPDTEDAIRCLQGRMNPVILILVGRIDQPFEKLFHDNFSGMMRSLLIIVNN